MANEQNFLKKEMNQWTFIHPESVLRSYLLNCPITIKQGMMEEIVFPFRINLSQKAALEKAIASSISIIKGPSGTGKNSNNIKYSFKCCYTGKKCCGCIE